MSTPFALKNNRQDLPGLNKNIAFRVDASAQIGTGHVMRCLALADWLQRLGAYVCFFSRHMPDILGRSLIENGHDLVLLKTRVSGDTGDGLRHSDWLGTSLHADAQDAKDAMCGRPWHWLVVDHYALDARWERDLRQTAPNLLAIDDIADRQHDCDVLLDQNLFKSMHVRYVEKVPRNCKLLMGPDYALLRSEFAELRSRVGPRRGPVNRLLIQMGGVDGTNQTKKVMDAVTRLRKRDFEVDVMIGAQHPAGEEIATECKRHGYVCHVQTPEVAKIMASADLAIGATGSTSWERCCLGVPTICTSLASNQVEIAKGLQARGALIYLGDAEKLRIEDLTNALSSAIENPGLLHKLSSVSYGLVDGRGVERVCEAMLRAA